MTSFAGPKRRSSSKKTFWQLSEPEKQKHGAEIENLISNLHTRMTDNYQNAQQDVDLSTYVEPEGMYAKFEIGKSRVLQLTAKFKQEQRPDAKFPSADGMEYVFQFLTPTGEPKVFTTTSAKFLVAMRDAQVKVGEWYRIERLDKYTWTVTKENDPTNPLM